MRCAQAANAHLDIRLYEPNDVKAVLVRFTLDKGHARAVVIGRYLSATIGKGKAARQHLLKQPQNTAIV
jgi:hypothetical protein